MSASSSTNEHQKDFKICDVNGGLDVTRLVSNNVRSIFLVAIEDVELMREYVSEMAFSGNWTSDFASLEEMSQSLDWKGRNLPNGTTTVEAGIGYADDRPNRRVDRQVKFHQDILLEDSYAEFLFADSLSSLMPWIVDRKAKESEWWVDHQNGRSEGDNKETFSFKALYSAGWFLGPHNSVNIYYPPLWVYGQGKPLAIGDVVGENPDMSELPFMKPASPDMNPDRVAMFTVPYPDTAVPGLALVSTIAPVYYTGNFHGYWYQDRYMGVLGLDMQVNALSEFLSEIQDTVTAGSFGVLVDSKFNTVVISQEVVRRIYPARTGMEENRITYDAVDGSILDDRRNQTYLPSDTILQDLTKLENADWNGLLKKVQKTPRGERDFTYLNVTLTGHSSPSEFIVMFENWDTVTDWTLLVFASKPEMERAIQVYATALDGLEQEPNSEATTVAMEGRQGDILDGTSMIVNRGNLDVTITLSKMPAWINITDAEIFMGENMYTLQAGDSIAIQYQVATGALATGAQTYYIVFEVQDDQYPDCYYSSHISIPFTVIVNPKDCGDQRVVDANGNCVCNPGSFEVNGNCMKSGGIVVSILLPLLALVSLAVYMYLLHKRRREDALWEIDPSELTSEIPPKIVGEGSFGHVILAQYRGTTVAVKSIRPFGVKGPISTLMTRKSATESQASFDAMEKGTLRSSAIAFSTGAENDFVKEIRLLSKLQHRNIVCVMGAVMKNRAAPQLVLEYMEKGSLHHFLRREAVIDGDLILGILKDVIQGIRYLHNFKPPVIHKDLKCKNILIDDHNRAKLSDFGGGAKGTPFWLAPELIRGAASTTASDVYALGITLYEIYAKAAPYEGEDPVLVLQQVQDEKVNKRPPFPPTMKSCVAAIMHDCLVVTPDERPTMDELAVRIDRFKAQDVAYEVKKEEQDASLGFLYKMFPAHVAKAISEGSAVEPDWFKSATVVYCEIVGFVALSATLPPIKVGDMMHRLFDCFDLLADGYGVFKIDLSGGGAWMGATNCILDQSNDHVKQIAQFAIDASKSAGQVLVDELHPESGYLQVQIAFASGPMGGKVVGSRPPRYSLFGPIVDAASFLAGNKAEPGGILCNEAAQELLEKQAPEIATSVRARVFVPGCGAVTTFEVNPKPTLE